MGQTWQEIYPDVDGPPIRDDAERYFGAAREMERSAGALREIVGAFHEFSRVDSARLEGRAARALLAQVKNVDTRLADVAPVFDDVAAALRHHGHGCRDLQQDMTTALLRARTGFDMRTAAQSDIRAATAASDTAGDELRTIGGQIDHWRRQMEDAPVDDPGRYVASDQVAKLETRRQAALREANQAASQLDQARERLSTAEGSLEWWRRASENSKSWRSLREAEDALRRETADKLDAIDLRGLEDPWSMSATFADVGLWSRRQLEDAGRLFGDAAEWAMGDTLDIVDGFLDDMSRDLGRAIVGLAALTLLFPPAGVVTVPAAAILKKIKVGVDVASIQTAYLRSIRDADRGDDPTGALQDVGTRSASLAGGYLIENLPTPEGLDEVVTGPIGQKLSSVSADAVEGIEGAYDTFAGLGKDWVIDRGSELIFNEDVPARQMIDTWERGLSSEPLVIPSIGKTPPFGPEPMICGAR